MNVDLQEQTRKLLEEPLLGEQDMDAEIQRLVEAEYMRRLRRYRRADRNLRQKHGTTFEDFMADRVVQQEGYAWEAETDAMDWETAVDGMETIWRKLHPFHSPDEREPLSEGLGPKPLLSFLAKVEDLLLQHELL